MIHVGAPLPQPALPRRGAARFRIDGRNDADEWLALWGALGPPEHPAAKMIHVVEARFGTMRHAFYPAGAIVGEHRHERPSITYGSGGPCIEQSLGKLVEKRRLTYHPTGYAHSLHYLGPTHVVSIEFDLTSLAEDGMPDLPARPIPLPATFYNDLWTTFICLAEAERRSVALSPMDRFLERIVALEKAPIPDWLEAVIDDIHQLWRQPLSATALALRHGKSPEHLCRLFKATLGVTMGHYLMLLRLDRARALLWGSGIPIAQVAAMTGFSDQSHLSRSLSALHGRTPKRFRWSAPCEARDDARLDGPGHVEG